MWSGPRNLSTALLRAWENRGDTFVADEPLYPHFLVVTGRPDPYREEVLAAYETDWRRVADWLTGPVPEGKPIFYQKHMTMQLFPHMSRDWMDRLVNCFLIRSPEEVVASYVKQRAAVGAEDIGFEFQAELFGHVAARTGRIPPVVDARDLAENPRGTLAALCAAVGVPFSERMLSWPKGPRASDGLWGRHWYKAVEDSTGWLPPHPSPEPLPEPLQELATRARPHYAKLHRHRLRPAAGGGAPSEGEEDR
ncbi:MAG: HAD family hydrolase [Proteobacteria bacterium]|nr:HAD family hydrolase [Pseudomonadota bacterium]